MYDDKVLCPSCGSNDCAEILYGLPIFDRKLERAIDKKEVVLGGCMVEEGAPSRRCNACGHGVGGWGR
jgi:hypothetical protein